MPLIKSGSKEAVSENIRRERSVSRPQRQAVAIALSTARRYGRKYAEGGEVDPINEWESVPRSEEGRPQITVTKPPATPSEIASKYARGAVDWFNAPSQIKPDQPPPQGFTQEPSHNIGEGVRGMGAEYLHGLKELGNPFTKAEDDKSYVADQPMIPNAQGKVLPNQKDIVSMAAPIAAEVAGTFGGVPGTGAAWGALKAAGYGVSKAAIAFGAAAAKQGIKKAPELGLAAKIAGEQGYLDTSTFKQVGHQLGYMPGGVYKDASGVPYYLKVGPSIEQVKNENLGAKLYDLAGTPVADVNITHIKGQPGIASKFLPNSHQLSEVKLPYNEIPGLHDNFVVDAWLGNHDAVGTGGENPLGNIMIADGHAFRVDTGGSLRFKGSGQPKNHFNDEADEIFSMRDPQFSKRSAQVFGEISDEALKAGAQKVADVDIQKLTELVARYGPSDDAEKAALVTKLIKRRSYIMDHFGVEPNNAAKPFEDEVAGMANAQDHGRLKEPKQFDHPDIPEEWHVGELPDGMNEPIASPSWMKKAKDTLKEAIFSKDEFKQTPFSGVKDTVADLLNTAYIRSYKEKYIAKSIWEAAKMGDMAAAKEAKDILPPELKSAVNKQIWEMKNSEKSAKSNKIGNELFGKKSKSATELAVAALLPEPPKAKLADKLIGILGDEPPPSNLKSGPSSPNPKVESFVPHPHGWSNSKLHAPVDANKLVKAAHGDMKFIANELYKVAKDSDTYADEIFKKLPLMKTDQDAVVQHWNDIEKAKGPANPAKKTGKEAIWLKDNPKGIAYASNFFQPIEDWKNWKPITESVTKPYFPNKLRETLAKAQGYNTNFEIHKGGTLPNVHPEHEEYPQFIKHPIHDKHKDIERAWFGSDKSGVAPMYGTYTGGAYIARGAKGKIFEVDWHDYIGSHSWHPEPMHNLIEAARAKGADMVIVHNMSDMGSAKQTQYAVLEPKILRSPKAKFSPDLIDKSWPLAGLVGGGLFTYGATKDDKMNRGGVPQLLNRVKKFAGGGAPRRGEYAPWDINQGANWRIKPQPSGHIPHMGGMIKSSIPGRTDKIPLSVKAGSYILPADIPSAIGQGNTESGAQILGRMFKISGSRSSGGKMPGFSWMKQPKYMKADGGGTGEQTENVPIIAAGGEMVIPPEVVTELGHGDMGAGHKVLDRFVLNTRKQNIETLKKLKPPKNG